MDLVIGFEDALILWNLSWIHEWIPLENLLVFNFSLHLYIKFISCTFFVCVICYFRAWDIPLPNGPWQIKLVALVKGILAKFLSEFSRTCFWKKSVKFLFRQVKNFGYSKPCISVSWLNMHRALHFKFVQLMDGVSHIFLQQTPT